jgi:hypothetical protein
LRIFCLAPTARNCASICACFPSLHDALGLQRFDILFAQSHSAKDLGVVLAELGGDRTPRMLPSILPMQTFLDALPLAKEKLMAA